VFQRPRPELAYIHLETYSYPSGHAAVATATFTTLAFVLGRRSGRRRTIAIAAAAIALIALVGFSRLYLGVHYPSDVVAGVIIGLSWAAFCMATLEAIQRFAKRNAKQVLKDEAPPPKQANA
jgi:undecaprenyl-diphosphatase